MLKNNSDIKTLIDSYIIKDESTELKRPLGNIKEENNRLFYNILNGETKVKEFAMNIQNIKRVDTIKKLFYENII